MTNEKKPNAGGTQASSTKTSDLKLKPEQGDRNEADKKPNEKGKTLGQNKR